MREMYHWVIIKGRFVDLFTSEPWRGEKGLKRRFLALRPDHIIKISQVEIQSLYILAISMILIHIKIRDPLILVDSTRIPLGS